MKTDAKLTIDPPVALSATLDAGEVSYDDFQALAADHLIEIGGSASDVIVTLLANGTPFATAALVSIDGRLGLRIRDVDGGTPDG